MTPSDGAAPQSGARAGLLQAGDGTPLRRVTPGLGAAAFAVFLLEAIVLQYAAGAFSSDFAAYYSDEAAHFVTSLMVRDYLTSDLLFQPWQFAQQYYLHYPKVAVGHWPPGLYGALGVWLLGFGVSRMAAMLFMAVVAALLSFVTYATGVVLLGEWAGWFAGAALLALPLTQEATSQVMAEHLGTLLMLTSGLQFARSVRSDRLRDWALFGVSAAAAILTSASCLALAFVPPLFVLLTGQYRLGLSPKLWSSAAIVVAICGPWYAFSQGITAGEDAFAGGGFPFVREAVVHFPMVIATTLGLVVAPLAALGVWTRVAALWRSRRIQPVWAVLTSLVVAKVLLHIAIQAGLESRYMLATMPCLLLLAAAGIDRIAGGIEARGRRPFLRPALAVLALVALAAGGIALPAGFRGDGYTSAAAAVTATFGNVPQVYLIASDSRGEGSWIAGIAIQEQRPSSIILRGSKVFTREDWLGRGTEGRFESIEEVRAMLDRIPISTVVIDETTASREARAYHEQVAVAVSMNPATWQRVATFPVSRRGTQYPTGLVVYHRRGTGQPALPDLAFIASLALRDGIK